jgi:thioesterase domain-containing protein
MDQSSVNQEAWKGLMRDGLEVYEVPGDHMDVIKKSNAAAWAERLKSCIANARTPVPTVEGQRALRP